jgi:hypothetical protein
MSSATLSVWKHGKSADDKDNDHPGCAGSLVDTRFDQKARRSETTYRQRRKG